jgi:hypothetical protein
VVELGERGLPRAVLEQRPAGAVPRNATGAETGVAVDIARSTDEWTRREIESVGEVWRVDDEWWRQPISRRYVEVIMKGGKHSVLYLDLNTNEWFEQTP